MSAVMVDEAGTGEDAPPGLDIGMLLESVARSFAGRTADGREWRRAVDLG